MVQADAAMVDIKSLKGRSASPAEFTELAKMLRRNKRLDAADDVVAVGLSLYQGNSQLAEQIAENLMARGDWSAASDRWQELLSSQKLKPTPGRTAKLLRSLRRAERLDEAAAFLANGHESGRQHSGFLQEAALVAAARADWEKAASTWREMAVLSTGISKASQYVQWSIAERKLGNFDEAARILEMGHAKLPHEASLRNELGTLELERRVEAGELPRYDTLAAVASNDSGPTLNVADICEFFWDIEKKHSLLSWQVNGVFPWPLVRMQLYYRVTQLIGLFTPPHPAAQEQLRQASFDDDDTLAAYWASQERKAKLRSGFLAGLRERLSPRRSHALLMATRKVDGVEPYCAALRAELDKDTLLLDRSFNGTITDSALNLSKVQDLFRARYGRPEHSLFPVEDQVLCHHLRGEFLNRLGVDPGNIALECQKRIRAFIPIRDGAKILFTSNRTSTLFITYAYGANNQAMAAGARDCGAKIVELQHGFISPLHLGYSWPGNPDVPYTPDELWGFGDFWPQATPLPARTRWRTIGAPYVRDLARAHAEPRDPKLVVFTSQGVIGQRLFEIALEAAERRPDYRMIFRLHPNEAPEPYEAALAQRTVPGNFELSHRTPNIFALLSRTAIQVGSFSTTLFEGMTLGTRTVVMDLPGAEYMRPAIERGDALFAADVDELVEKLDQAPLAADPQFYYAEPAKRLL